MTGNTENMGRQRGRLFRKAAWSVAVLVLLLPLAAMQFTEEVNWTALDFAFAGVLVFGTGIAFELAVRKTGNPAYRAGVGVALAAAFLLVWLSASVGIIGKDGDPANLVYLGVLAVGITGAITVRFQPRGMAYALVATALAQALIAAIAVASGWGYPWSGPLELLGLNGFFVVLFITSALLFQKAAREK